MKSPTAKKPASIEPRSPAQIHAELAEHQAAKTAADADLGTLRLARADVLAADDEAAIDQHDIKIAKVARASERAAARIAKLQAELSVVEEREARDAVTSLKKRALEAQREATGLIARDYPDAARAVAAICGRLVELQSIVDEANRNLPFGELVALEQCRAVPGKSETKTVVEQIFYVDSETGKEVPTPTMIERQGKVTSVLPRKLTRKVRERMIVSPPAPPRFPNPLIQNVNLPGVVVGDPSFWGWRGPKVVIR
jgi:hypothetical protein